MPSGYVNNNEVKAYIKLTVNSQPVITVVSEPTTQYVEVNKTPEELSVGAEVSDNKILTYQWFKQSVQGSGVFIQDVDGYETITGETKATYTPKAATGEETAYYYCVISSGEAEPVTVLAGAVKTVKVLSKPAETPVIITQPMSIADVKASDTVNLSVNVKALSNGGTLKYQWYRQNEALSVGGVAIEGATSAELAIKVTDTAYYYVEVSNENPGYDTVMIASDTACVSMTQ
jgi:hypothetical protein